MSIIRKCEIGQGYRDKHKLGMEFDHSDALDNMKIVFVLNVNEIRTILLVEARCAHCHGIFGDNSNYSNDAAH